MRLRGVGDVVNVQLQTSRGDLRVEGQGQWRLRPGNVEFSGTARASDHEAQLQPLLQMIGSDAGGGQRKLSFSSRLALPQ
jgi:hypothetical protein